jgi:hypothetical protein
MMWSRVTTIRSWRRCLVEKEASSQQAARSSNGHEIRQRNCHLNVEDDTAADNVGSVAVGAAVVDVAVGGGYHGS